MRFTKGTIQSFLLLAGACDRVWRPRNFMLYDGHTIERNSSSHPWIVFETASWKNSGVLSSGVKYLTKRSSSPILARLAYFFFFPLPPLPRDLLSAFLALRAALRLQASHLSFGLKGFIALTAGFFSAAFPISKFC